LVSYFVCIILVSLTAVSGIADAWAEFVPERVGAVERLPASPGKHWLWVYDTVYDYTANGRAVLIDGDSGRFIGMLNGGYWFTQLSLPRDYSAIYAAETHYSRTTRGDRTDIVAIYDPMTLSPIGEVEIPPKRALTVPSHSNAVLTDDDRLLLIFNFTPAASVTVVDVETRRMVAEIDTPGCALVYPAGARKFFMLASDGAACEIELTEAGDLATFARSAAFFDPESDPVSERAVRWGRRWLFVSFEGYVHGVDFSGPTLAFDPAWSLLSEQDRADNWRVGGIQHLAVHKASGRLYSVVHQAAGGMNTRKEPGMHIWVYDLQAHQRIQVVKTRNPTNLIQVTQDDAPVLFTGFLPVGSIDVYDALKGEYLRTVDRVGYTPTGLETPWTGGQ
jgi:methylamine dehydrogenase heavy chain